MPDYIPDRHLGIFITWKNAEVRIEAEKKTSSLNDPVSGDEMVEEVMNEADTIRLKFFKDKIEPLHLLAAISTPGVGFSFEQLKTFPLRREELITAVTDETDIQTALGKSVSSANGKRKCPKQALLKYCIDKTLQAKEGRIDAIIGRDKEIRMMSEILCRRSKPNVLIVGEPGVGKSSLVDAFAIAVQEQKVPQHLHNAHIFELDNGALIAGASYKGEIEDRLKSILTEIKMFDAKQYYIIDEIHY